MLQVKKTIQGIVGVSIFVCSYTMLVSSRDSSISAIRLRLSAKHS
jgi:hypothetical protein